MTTPQLLAGRYEIGDVLGFGGMAEVHRGRDTVLGRDVAVKIMRSELARDDTFYRRFRREAQNSASLNHPSIVAIYDTGEEHVDGDDLPYIVMEVVEGDTIRDVILMDGPMEIDRALGVMADVCGAIDFSHRKGIIHRDVKPANIMISHDGAVKVMDFGIARAISDSTSTLTQTSSVLGTAQYLSPEQARGESVDSRSDIYSAGCVLYEMVTGAPPFTGESPVAVAYQHVREDPAPPSTINPELDRYVDAVVMQAMAKNPDNRYSSAGDMRSDLLTVLSGGRPNAPLVLSEDELEDEHRPDAHHGFTSTGWGSPSEAATEVHQLAATPAAADPTAETGAHRRTERTRPRSAVIAVAILLVLAMIAGLSVWATSGDGDGDETVSVQEVTIPEVAQRPVDEVVAQLTGLGFEPIQHPESDLQIPAGVVVSSDPIAGKRLPRGSEIHLVVSTGKPILSVPNVMGMAPADARRVLEEAGFQIADENVTKPSTGEDRDKVLNTDPGPGSQVPSDQPVTLTVGSGPQQVAVPGVVGRDADSARAALEAAGFSVDTVRVDGTATEDQVIGQSTPAGQTQLKGATITIRVSAGNRFEMPNIVDDTVEVALDKLRSAGWRGDRSRLVELPQNDPDLSRVGKIFSQQPPMGEASVNDQVVVRVIRFGLIPGPG